jgi:GT2 family glycosyltransferase
MLQNISKHIRSTKSDQHFSILIPTWNNLEYLKLCVRSIRENSSLSHQMIIILNEGKDGSLEWVQAQKDLDYVYAKENIGICYGLNITRSMILADYVLYANDDMYLLPNWDAELWKEIEQIGHKEFMLSATMIEPFDTGNPSVIIGDYGDSLESFQEQKLLKDFASFQKEDWNGSTWPPNVMHRDLWDLVGGMSVEFHPGMYSDPDLSKKLWDAGVRYYKGIAKSRVYHFGSKSTRRIKRNIGSRTFLSKWGITSRTFTVEYLHRGQPFQIADKEAQLSTSSKIANLVKRIKAAF